MQIFELAQTATTLADSDRLVADTGVTASAATTKQITAKNAIKAPIQKGSYVFAAAGGTADAVTATLDPVPDALTDGMHVFVEAASANATTTPTLNVNSLGAKTIVKYGGNNLVAGDIVGAGHMLVFVYDADADKWELINPASSVVLTLDLDGDPLWLDEDADSKLHAPTDDQLDLHLNGVMEYTWTATGFRLKGNQLVFDADNDTYIDNSADDVLDIYLNGARDFILRANEFELQTGSELDLNGCRITLDADDDTYLDNATDDVIKVYIAGAQDFTFSANSLQVETGSVIDMNGCELILDADGNTSITADTNDQIDVRVGGADVFKVTTTGLVYHLVDSGPGIGPQITLFRDSSSPAALDYMGAIAFNGEDSLGNETTYAKIKSQIETATDGSEQAIIIFETMAAGQARDYLTIAQDAITVSSHDNGASAKPSLILDRVSNSAAADDEIGLVEFRGRDSLGNATTYSRIRGKITDPTNGSEDGKLIIELMVAGTARDYFTLSEDTFTVTSVDASATANPVLILDRNSASPAALDLLGRIDFVGRDSGGNSTTYGRISTEIVSPTDGSEDAQIVIYAMSAGSLVEQARVTENGMRLTSADAGASSGPLLKLMRNSASPAASDSIGRISFNGNDSGGNEHEYARVGGLITDPTNASEDGRIQFQTSLSGSLATRFNIENGFWGQTATGGDQGLGTGNFTGVFDDGVAICYPIEYARTGTINVADWDDSMWEAADGSERPHPLVREFLDVADMVLDPDQFADFWKEYGHLPTLIGRDAWNALKAQGKKVSIGTGGRQLWETVEVLAVHIDKLNQRIKELEAKVNEQ